jgi:hypothetical protein
MNIVDYNQNTDLLYIGEDDFDDMGDHHNKDIISLDFNTLQLFLSKECNNSFVIKDFTFDGIFAKLEKRLTKEDKNRHCLILMKIRDFNDVKEAERMGWKISELFEDSMVMWGCRSFSKSPKPRKDEVYHSHKFKFYLYD